MVYQPIEVKPGVQSLRPRFHVVAPTGWMNDPCAPCYNPLTGTFHLFYQWNPKSTVWDDISWGHVQSKDLLTWKIIHSKPIFKPGPDYDRGGVFTGCMHVSPGSGEMTVIYTSASVLPIHWTREHVRGSEGVSIMSSTDDGHTWKRHPSNPIIPHEPSHLIVTGFRDPFVASWPEMDQILGVPSGSLYGLISGGTADGPNIFLHRIDRDDLTKWDFIGPLLDIPRHHRVDFSNALTGFPGNEADHPHDTHDQRRSRWAGRDLGCNWECTTFITLKSDGHEGTRVQVLLPSAEGAFIPERYVQYRESHPNTPKRSPSGANWLFGDLALDSQTGTPRFTPTTSGLLDHAALYACTLFPHPDGRTILWGWIMEGDVTVDYLERKGWTGCLGVPREIFLCPLGDVSRGLHTAVDDMCNMKRIDGIRYTLGIRPIKELDKARARLLLDSKRPRLCSPLLTPVSQHLDIRVSVACTPDSIFALHVKHNSDLSLCTTIIFSAAAETISVDRSLSTEELNVNTMEELGPFTLFHQKDSSIEPLQLRVLVDGDVIEVFANDRFSLSTRTYSPASCSNISIAAQECVVEHVSVWDMGSIGLT